MYAYRIKKYIATVNGIEAIRFTVGEFVRSMICYEMDFLGIILDEKKNTIKASEYNKSRVKILIIPTDEEIAREVFYNMWLHVFDF